MEDDEERFNLLHTAHDDDDVDRRPIPDSPPHDDPPTRLCQGFGIHFQK